MACKNCEDKIIVPVSTSCEGADSLENGSCQSFKGKFYDKSIAEFVVPQVGKIGFLNVCEANLWASSQFVGVCIGKSKYAFFRIVETGQHILKILNGCEKGNPESGIAGNPEPGTVIPENATLFPCPPIGCSSQLAQEFSSLLNNYGADGVIKILKESDGICFTATPELDETETAHLFGGTFVDCDCSPQQNSFLSCLRKIVRIFTGQGGKTICMPDVNTTTYDDVDVDGDPISKRIAIFDERGCIKKGGTVKEAVNTGEFSFVKIIDHQELYNGITTTVTVNWDSLSIPDQIGGRQIWADIELYTVLAGGPGCQLAAIVNSVEKQRIYTTVSGGNAEQRITIMVPATAGENITIQAIKVGTTTQAQMVAQLIKYYV